MKAKSRTKLTTAIVMFTAIAANTALTQTVQHNWTGGGANSVWSNPANWSNEQQTATAPTLDSDMAIIDIPGVESETELDQDIVNDLLEVRNGSFTMNIGAHKYTATNSIAVCPGDGQTGTLRIASGHLEFQPTIDSIGYSTDYLPIVTAGANSKASLVIEGEGTVLTTKRRLKIAGPSSSEVEMIVADGATLSDANRISINNGSFMVSNATFSSYMSGWYIGTDPGTTGKASFVGADSKFTGEMSSLHLGYGAGATGTLYIGPDVLLSPGTFYPYLGSGIGTTGVITMVGATISTAAGGARPMSLTLGRSTRVAIDSAPPSIRGVGFLNLLDGALLKGFSSGTGQTAYVYIGPNCGIRIRDSRLSYGDTNTENRRIQPFWFRTDSFLTIELTGDTVEKMDGEPFILSDADYEPYNVNKIDAGAKFNLVLKEGYRHKPGTSFDIFRYTGVLEGEFEGLPDGAFFRVDDNLFGIDYGEGADSCIVVTALATPGTTILVR